MSDLEQCIEGFHKPRIAKLAEFLLAESEFSYDYFEPPAFETYMVQIKLPEDLIISVNYFPIEITNDAPFLFLQFHCLIQELDDEPSADLLKYLSYANNNTELSAFHVDDNRLFLKALLIDEPREALDLARVSFLLRIIYNNLVEHLPPLKLVIEGSTFESVASS